MFTPTLVLVTLIAGPEVVVIDSRGDGFRSETSVNGFPTEHMPSVQSISERTTGYPSWDHRCFPVHPYFLRPGANTAVMTYTFDDSLVAREEKGPWTQSVEVVTSTLVDEAQPVSLAKQSGPALTRAANKKPQKLTVTFKLPTDPPAWGWMKGVAIADNKEAAASLYAEYQKLWATLEGLPKQTPADRDAFRAATRASTAEFIRASESRGKRYTFVEDLTHAAGVLGMPGEFPPVPEPKGKAKTKKAEDPKVLAPPSLAPVHDAPSDTGPNDWPHLKWVPLPAAGHPGRLDQARRLRGRAARKARQHGRRPYLHVREQLDRRSLELPRHRQALVRGLVSQERRRCLGARRALPHVLGEHRQPLG